MWVKPWNMKEGFLMGGGLLITGLLLQVVLGPIRWEFFAWPVNLIVLLLLLAAVGVMYALRRKVYAFEWMMHTGAAVPCLVYAGSLTVLMGLLPQVREGGTPWLSQMLRFWPFVLVWTWMVVISALAALNHLLRWKVKEIPFVLLHLGVVWSVVSATLGYADIHELYLSVSGESVMLVDPWSGWVRVGIFILLAGAASLLLFMTPGGIGRKTYMRIMGGVLLLAAVFLYWTLSVTGPFVNNPNPALQSPWFAPHVTVYMFSYALLGAAAIMAIYLLIRKRASASEMNLTDNLVYMGLAFLMFGMLFGALWAKEAWGNYWDWDPKETWAAATWLCYLVYLHLRKAKPGEWKWACIILLVSFLCLQICWWGINYLPSAQGLSVHTYN
jgi:ABC-type transport system involved in cytochrome c biogenesis permease subunit